MVRALGRFKPALAAPALAGPLKDPLPAVRAAAAEAVGGLGAYQGVIEPLRALLNDPVIEVRKAAIAALGRLRDRESVPALVSAADSPETGYEGTIALTKIPDVRAVPVYLRGLTDKSPDLRNASVEALSLIRDDAVPLLTRLAERKELPSTALLELRKVYTNVHPIAKWDVLGPLPIDARPPFSVDGPIDLKAKYTGFQDEPLVWRPARAVDRARHDRPRAVYW